MKSLWKGWWKWNVHPPTHHQHPHTRPIQPRTLLPTHQHPTSTLLAPTALTFAIFTYKMSIPPLTPQRQMHRLRTHDILINHLPDLEREHREKARLTLRMRARIKLSIR